MTTSRLSTLNTRTMPLLRKSLLIITFLIYPASNISAAPSLLTGIDVSYEDDSITVAINCDTVKYYDFHQLPEPTRWYIDLRDTIVPTELNHMEYSIEGDIIRSIRLSQNRPDVARLVFDLKQDAQPTIKTESNPPQLLLTWKSKISAAAGNSTSGTDSSSKEQECNCDTAVIDSSLFLETGDTDGAEGAAIAGAGAAAERNLPEGSPPAPAAITETQVSDSTPGRESGLGRIWPQDNQANILLSIIMGQVIFLIIITLSIFYLISKGLMAIRQNRQENTDQKLAPKYKTKKTA